MIKQLLKQLEYDDYTDAAERISDLLKLEIQEPKSRRGVYKIINPNDYFRNNLAGLVKREQNRTDSLRKLELSELVRKFIQSPLTQRADIDEDLNFLCLEMEKTNQDSIKNLPYDYLRLFATLPNLQTDFPNFYEVYKVIEDEINNSSEVRWRLISIIGKHVAQSLSQRSVSLAGNAGEDIVRATLGCVGLKEDVDYRSQWKGGEGSDTDFVIPYVEDFDMSKIKVFIAAQFSSNDRARMASSELHGGAARYLVTGNGLDSSTKSMRDIGAEIVEGYMSANTKVVCRKLHMESVIAELKSMSGPSDNGRKTKIAYFENYHLSFSDFSKEMAKQI